MDYFYFRINSEIEETLRRFCRDKDLQKSSSRRSKVSDSQKTSEKYLEGSPWEFRESFRRFETISFKISHSAWFLSKNSEGPRTPLITPYNPPAPMPKQLSARRSEQRSFPGSKLVKSPLVK